MTRSFIKIALTALVTLASLNSAASYKVFEANIDQSSWTFQGNPLNCTLSHHIPLYGDAKFQKIAGKEEKLGFQLGYKRHTIVKNKIADVRALAPSWQPLLTSRELGQVELKPGKNIVVSQETASWRLLNELEIGRFPTFFYQDFNAIEDQVSVALSTVGFRQEYDKFLDCMANLVPFKINELSKMTLFFDFDRFSIRNPYKAKLDALAQYIKHDPAIEVVFMSGFTDSKGSRSYNQKLSQQRVESVKKLLQLNGVPDSRFKLNAFGEKQPVASNRTAKGRAKNRRVFIRLAQN